MWPDEKSVANTMGFADAADQHPVTCDSRKEDAFQAHTDPEDDIEVTKFARNHATNLHNFEFPEAFFESQETTNDNLKEKCENDNTDSVREDAHNSQFIETVAENRMNHTTHQCERAKVAQKLCHDAGAPAPEHFAHMLKTNWIENDPVTSEDTKITQGMFGKDVSCLKSKTTRSTPPVAKEDAVETPRELCTKHKKIVLHVDALNINRMKFSAAVGKPSCCRSAPGAQTGTHQECFKSPDEMSREHNHAGFTMSETRCDQEHSGMMDQTKDDLNTDTNCVNPQDHESDTAETLT